MRSHTFAVCAYGDSPYLESCIKSLKNQTVPSDILLCTSTPSTFIKDLADRYGIPVYVREGASDIQADWNYAYHMAGGDLVTIAHQDDLYHRHYARMVQICWKHYPDTTVMASDAGIVKNNRLVRPGRVELVKKLLRLSLRIPKLNHLTWVKLSALRFGNPIMCPSCTYHKKVLGEPLFRSQYKFALDWDTMAQLAKRPGRFLCVEKPLLYYRIHEGAATKRCILDHTREREETEMFRVFWPEWAVKFLMKGYRKAYDSYD